MEIEHFEIRYLHYHYYVATVRDYLKFYRDEKEAGTPEDQINEKWSRKYKQGIDCSHPKGFSQRAHCAGRRARRAGRRTTSSSVSEVELYNDVLKDLVEELTEEIGNSYMAMGALKQINNDAKELQSMLKPDTQLEDWVKAKLNLAGEYLDDVYHHLDHFGSEGRKLDDVDEAVTDPRFLAFKKMSPEELERYIHNTQEKKKKESSTVLLQKAYWIDPQGNLIAVNSHDAWAKEKYPNVSDPKMEAFRNGYIRMVYSVRNNGSVDVEFQNVQSPSGEIFNKHGNSSLGIPPVKSQVIDVMRQFIRDKNSLTSDVTGGNLEEAMNIEENWKNWKQALATTALATSMLGAPKADAAPEKIVSPQTVSATSQQYGYTVEDIIAATLVDEAGGEKNAGEGMHAVLNVIMNRAKGNIRNAAMECLKPKQFSGWNKVNKKDVNDIKKFIDSKKNHSKYKEAIKLVQQAKSGTLKDITKGSNHFLNVHLTKQQRSGGKLPSWYDPKKVVTDFGKHRFLKLEEVYELA